MERRVVHQAVLIEYRLESRRSPFLIAAGSRLPGVIASQQFLQQLINRLRLAERPAKMIPFY